MATSRRITTKPVGNEAAPAAAPAPATPHTCVRLLWSTVTPVSGAIGAAREVPGMAPKIRAVIAIAKMVRVLAFFLP